MIAIHIALNNEIVVTVLNYSSNYFVFFKSREDFSWEVYLIYFHYFRYLISYFVNDFL